LNNSGIYGDVRLEKKNLTLTFVKETKMVNNIVRRTVEPVGAKKKFSRNGD